MGSQWAWAAMARAAEDGGAAVVEGDGVVGEPGGEGLAAAGGDGLGEAAFELEEDEDAGGEGGLGEGVVGAVGVAEGLDGELRGGGGGCLGREGRRGDQQGEGRARSAESREEDGAPGHGAEQLAERLRRSGIWESRTSLTVRRPSVISRGSARAAWAAGPGQG